MLRGQLWSRSQAHGIFDAFFRGHSKRGAAAGARHGAGEDMWQSQLEPIWYPWSLLILTEP